jgi:hypothetical protein
MSEPNLEQVKRVAEQLSPEDRIQLFHHIADLPDSGIQSGSIDPPSPLISPEDKKKVEEMAGTDQPVVLSTDTHASIFVRGRAILQVFFFPNNFQQSRVEIRSWKDAPPTDKTKEQIRGIFSLHGAPEPTEEQIIAALTKAQRGVFEAETFRLSREFSARLGHMIWLLYEAGMKVVELAYRNDYALKSGRRTQTLEEMVTILEPYWEHIKAQLNPSPGGRRNVKHEWTVKDHTCLAVHYDRLKPIWREAKKTAKAALKSPEPTRRNNWKEQVTAAYKDDELPVDLVEQLAPSVNSKPADLALIHAARICLPGVSYSTKVLKQKLRHLNPVSRPSPRKTKNGGSS